MACKRSAVRSRLAPPNFFPTLPLHGDLEIAKIVPRVSAPLAASACVLERLFSLRLGGSAWLSRTLFNGKTKASLATRRVAIIQAI